MIDAHQAIRAVSRRTGLSPHVIRIWEKRYGAVAPRRTETNRRLYSDAEIERLRLLGELTRAGHSIGHVARLPTRKLRELAAESLPASPPREAARSASSLLDECIDAVMALDARSLDETLQRASVQMGAHGLLHRLVAPLAQALGDLWRDGAISAAHEHFATAIIRVFLGHAARPYGGANGAPVLIVTTPAGQLHELGALLAAAAAANLGWNVTYLGASLPACEIAGAARQSRARAVALSLVYPEDDPRLEAELARLRELLPPDVALLAGGPALSAYRAALKRIGARQIPDLPGLCKVLAELRKPLSSSKS